MNKKLIITLAFSFLAGISLCSAQGLFNSTSEKETESSSSSVLEKPSTRFDFPETPTEPGDPIPVGEGLLILSALAGGYSLIKRRNQNKR